MPRFSQSSRAVLETCDVRLQAIFNHVVQVHDCTILVGHRNQADQDEAFRTGRSKLKWPDGKHNKLPSLAVDAAPHPIPRNWGEPGPDRVYSVEELRERAKFYFFAGLVKGIALERGVPLRWGGDWDGDHDFNDQTFDDLVHFEIVE